MTPDSHHDRPRPSSPAAQRRDRRLAGRRRSDTPPGAPRSAADAIRLQDEFLANVSHELRTPLGGIIAASELLHSEPLTADQERAVHIIELYSRRLVGLVDDLLDLAGVDMLPIDSEPTPFDLRASIAATCRALDQAAVAKGLALRLRIHADVPGRVVGLPRRLARVLHHLLDNGIKFTEHGEVALAVEVEKRGPCRVTVRCTVTDTGIGIPKDQRERIFAAFVQGDGSATRRFGGTGVGLAIAAQAVAAMGGTLRLTSRESTGSSFSFTAVLGLPRPPDARDVTTNGER